MRAGLDYRKWLAWFYVAVLLSLIYRISYGVLLYGKVIPGIFFQKESSYLTFATGFTEDLKITLIAVFVLALGEGILRRCHERVALILGEGFGYLLLIALAFGYLGNFYSACHFFVSMSYPNLKMAWEMSSRSGLWFAGGAWFLSAMLIPLIWTLGRRFLVALPHRIMILGILILGLLPLLDPLPHGNHTDLSVQMNPLRFLQLSYEVCRSRVGLDWEVKPLDSQWKTPEWIDPLLAGETTPAPIRFNAAVGSRPWNVVVVVVEAMGASYPFDKSIEGKVPMPFFEELSKKGVWLKNHYASGNNTAPALYALFSGRYAPLNNSYLTASADVPLIHQMIPEAYRPFLVRPAPREVFFPTRVFQNSGFPELLDFHALKAIPRAPSHMERREEVGCFQFFMEEIRKRDRFFAIYQSFVPHFYYEENGAEFRRFTLPESRNYAEYFQPRYYNGLYLMDTQIQALVRMLEETGRMKETILVVVGDHGEGFEQHRESFMHGMQSYEEIIHSAALIYQPDLFPPQEVELPTSHVDLLPTLLRFIPTSKPAPMAGEDLTKPVKRKYVFSDAYLFRGEVVSISRDRVKYTLDDRRDSVKSTDLKEDPEEKNLRQGERGEQFQATALFRRLQLRPLLLMREEEKIGK